MTDFLATKLTDTESELKLCQERVEEVETEKDDLDADIKQLSRENAILKESRFENSNTQQGIMTGIQNNKLSHDYSQEYDGTNDLVASALDFANNLMRKDKEMEILHQEILLSLK